MEQRSNSLVAQSKNETPTPFCGASRKRVDHMRRARKFAPTQSPISAKSIPYESTTSQSPIY